MAYNSISTKHYIKSHLELQREITLVELAPSPYFFVSSICLAYMNMFARFDENPAMTLRVSPYFFVSSICLAYMNMFARFDENPAMTLRVIKEKALY